MDKLLLVDGSNLLFQMFFGMPARIVNGQGKAIQGTLGFVGALLKIIRMVEPTHMLVIFDGEHENNRCEIDAAYKANRIDYGTVSEEENPFSQLPDVCRALQYMGIRYIETTDCEADDMIAGYAYSYRDDTSVVISSFDSDLFGILPEQYADFKSLVGDTADNIKGVEKVGVKTAALLLQTFGTLEHIIENVERIDRPSIKKSIIENTDRLRKNYALIKLNHSQPLPYDKCELMFEDIGQMTTEVLRGIGLK